MALYSGLDSLMKWVIPIYQTFGLCEYLTYKFILLVSVASILAPFFDTVDVYVSRALSYKNPQLLAYLLMTSLSLLHGEHYTILLTIACPYFDGGTVCLILVGHGFLIGRSLCYVE
jgi:hypothetical protein